MESTKRRFRGLVSKKKKRFQEAGFDLDLTYITDRVLAMGFPSAGAEAMYRNPLQQVQRFFHERHPNAFRLYNLCSEREYDPADFHGRVRRFPFDDHNPCPLAMIPRFCKDIDDFLAENEKNVVAVHCKAGKGRTGLLVSAYLLHSGVCPDAQSALDYFASARTNDLQGVTIPSQMRYCHYYEKVLREGPRPTPIYQVTHIRINTVPAVRATGACEPFFKIAFEGRTKIYDYRKYSKKFRRYHATDFFMDIDCATHGVYISGDVKFVFYDHKEPSCKKFCHLWINTGYIESTYLHFSRDMVDKACKKKRKFSQNFAIEIFLHRVDAATEAIARKKLHAVATREMSKARRSAATVNVARTAARRGGSRLPAGVTATTGSGGGGGVRGTPGGAPPAAHAAAGAGTGAGVAAAAAAAASDASVFDDEDMVPDSDSGTDDDDDDDEEGRGGHHMGIAASAPARASAAESLLRMVAPPVVPARRASQRLKPVAGGGSVGSSSPRSNVRASPSPSPTPSPSPSPTPSPSPSPTPAGQRDGHGEGGGDGSSPAPAGDAAGSAVAAPGSLPADGGGTNGVRIKFTPPPPPSIPRGSPPPPNTAPATSNGGTAVPPRLARRRSSARKPLGNWS